MGLAAINMLWVRGALPWYVESAIRSFIHHRHQVHLYSYDTGYDLPVGCKLMDARKILSSNRIFGYRDGIMRGRLSGFADWFRYELLLQKGGWWVDADVICMAPFIAATNYVFASGWEPSVPRFVNNNVIYVHRIGDPLMAYCARQCRRLGDTVAFAETGPNLLHRVVGEHGLSSHVADPGTFNPVHYRDLSLLMSSLLYFGAVKYSRRFRKLRPVLLSRRTNGLHLYSGLFEKQFAVAKRTEIPHAAVLAHILRANGEV